MKTTYRSKVDSWLMAIILACLLPVFTLLYSDPSIVSILIAVFTLPVVGVLPFSIRYIVDHDHLIVRWGFVVSQRYPISQILSVRTTRSVLSAPAASLDRLEICCAHDSVIISPTHKEAFLRRLQEASGGRIRMDL